MLEIELGNVEYYDGTKNEFIYEEGGMARFEYSLKAIYEWEAKYRIPFLNSQLTEDQLEDFFLMMCIDDIDRKFIDYETAELLKEYIELNPTATRFRKAQPGQNGNTSSAAKVNTAEEIYAIMFMNGIPIEFEERNVNRLLTILRIIGNHNQPKKKMSRDEIYRQNRELNEARKAKLKTKG